MKLEGYKWRGPLKCWSALRFALFLLTLFLAAGCKVYYPHTTLKAPAISGTVVDASTHAPIAGAKISRAQHPQSMCVSDANGRFKLGKLHNWHYAVEYNLEEGIDLPEGENWLFETSVTVSQTNYLECTVNMATNHGDTIFLKKTGDVSGPVHAWLTFNGNGEILQDTGASGYLKPGSIKITKPDVTNNPDRIRIRFVQRVYNPFVTAIDQPDKPELSAFHEWGFVWYFNIHYLGLGLIPAGSLKDSSRIYKLEFIP